MDQLFESYNCELYVFTDGQNIEIVTGARLFCSIRYAEGSVKLNVYNLVFQSDIVGITERAKSASILTSKFSNLLVDR